MKRERRDDMIELRRILCPIDFSDFSRRALDHAVALAKWYDSTVTVFHVATVVPAAAYGPGDPILPSMFLTAEDREQLLRSLTAFATTEAGSSVPLQFDVGQGSAATEILAKTDAMRADLLVMGTHGRSGFERLVLGSVTEKVLRKATCAVLSVPRLAHDAVPAVLFKRILCAVDFSDCSMHALDYAVSLAQQARGELTVLHALELEPALPPELHETVIGGHVSRPEYIEAAENHCRERLKTVVPDSVRAQCGVTTLLLRGKPYREILRIALEQDSDVIVIGIHGRGAVDLMFFGSTAQHLVRQTSCPVLTLRKG